MNKDRKWERKQFLAFLLFPLPLPASCDQMRSGIVTWRQHDTKLLSFPVVPGLLDGQMTVRGRAGVSVCDGGEWSRHTQTHLHTYRQVRESIVSCSHCVHRGELHASMCVLCENPDLQKTGTRPDNDACPWKLPPPSFSSISSHSVFFTHALPPSLPLHPSVQFSPITLISIIFLCLTLPPPFFLNLSSYLLSFLE